MAFTTAMPTFATDYHGCSIAKTASKKIGASIRSMKWPRVESGDWPSGLRCYD